MYTKNLPEDVLVEILLRLPVKSLVRFRCVSERWLSLILDRQFAKSHFKRTAEPTQRLLVSSPLGLGSLEINESFAGGSSVRELVFPVKQGRRVFVLGSCNGLVFTALDAHKDFYIWNPSTRDRRKLVDPGVSRKIIYKYGFGYDSSTDDYKLLVAPRCNSSGVKCNLFSLKRNSWKSFQGLDCPYQCFEKAGIFSNGALHWQTKLIDPHYEIKIIAFDLAKEKFRKVLMPMDSGEYVGDFDSFGHIGGRLCFTSFSRTHIDLWGLMEYGGAQESWKIMFKVNRSENGVIRDDLTPLCFSRSGQLVAIVDSRGELIRSNPTGEIVESFLLCRKSIGSYLDIFVESLFSPHD